MKIAGSALGLIVSSGFLIVALQAKAFGDPLPCRKGAKGIYVTWGKNLSQSGRGVFNTVATQASVLPDFTWQATGRPYSVDIETGEPFSGGNSMKGIYG